MKKLIIIGAGGFSKVVLDSLDYYNYVFEGFIDTYKNGEHFGYKILGNRLSDIKERHKYKYFIAIGDPIQRKKWYEKLTKEDLELINIVDRTALISDKVKLSQGIYIGKRTIINPDVTIEENVVINTRALIEHGNYIGAHSNISTNAVLNGDVQIGRSTFIGSCTVVNGQLKIGNNVTIGSGSVVINDIEDDLVVAGSPVRLIRRVYNE